MSQVLEFPTRLPVSFVAALCHEANRLFCNSIGDYSQKPWEDAEQWQRDSAIKGVQYRLANPDAPESAQHDAWMADKLESGWVYGEVKDAEKKTHPCLVKYDALPEEQRFKDALFVKMVETFRDFITPAV